MVEPAASRLSLIVAAEVVGTVCLLTGSGFKVRLASPSTVRQFLIRELAIDPQYLQDRIQTILLDSKAVDDPVAAVVAAGSTLVLSAAMPGLAGATLRKGSRYASMRWPISHDVQIAGSPRSNQSNQPPLGREGDVTVKLFNMLQHELGPRLLKRGIRVSGKALSRFLHRQADALRPGILSAELDGRPVPVPALFDRQWGDREVHFRVGVSG